MNKLVVLNTIALMLLGSITKAQVGIGTTTPHESAILEVKSENKGFLPPRMTYQQILAINNPAEGLMAYCSNCCKSGPGLLTFRKTDSWEFMLDNTCSFIDTDRDFVIDDIDLDDDNDGILDTEESPTTIIIEETNGTFGQTSVAKNVEGNIPNYSFSTSGVSEGVYAVVSKAINPNWHPANIWDFFGHTDGSNTDAFLAVNGGASIGVFFEQTFPMIPNVEYKISFWHRGGTYNLKIDLIQESNSSIINSTQTGLSTNNVWTETTMTVTNTHQEVKLYRIELSNVSTAGSGNDFAIDDISVNVTDPNVNLSDYDLDGLNNSIDLDSDGDGIPDNVEFQSTVGYQAPGTTVDAQGRLINYGVNGLTSSINIDGDNLLDYLDTDTDGDGILDKDESSLTLTGVDSDNDGLDDGADEEVPGHSDINGKAINNAGINILIDTDGNGEKDYRQ